MKIILPLLYTEKRDRETERQREIERQRERQRDRERDGQTDGQTERHSLNSFDNKIYINFIEVFVFMIRKTSKT